MALNEVFCVGMDEEIRYSKYNKQCQYVDVSEEYSSPNN